MSERSVSIAGVSVPRFLYGTAWKGQRTEPLTNLALRQGFRGIDTANQRRHYDEAAVGRAVAAAVDGGIVARADVFLQTKFTYRRAHDDRVPYDPDASIPVQVEQSFASSLEHLGTDVVDALLLHQPVLKRGIAGADFRAWQAMEAIYERGQARLLGISNVSLEQLQTLNAKVRVRPHLVQNRCLARRGWDSDIRECCAANGQLYEAFSLIAGNPEALTSADLTRIADRHGRDGTQIVLRFALDSGMIPLIGTSDAAHMEADLNVFDFCLTSDEMRTIERVIN